MLAPKIDLTSVNLLADHLEDMIALGWRLRAMRFSYDEHAQSDDGYALHDRMDAIHDFVEDIRAIELSLATKTELARQHAERVRRNDARIAKLANLFFVATQSVADAIPELGDRTETIFNQSDESVAFLLRRGLVTGDNVALDMIREIGLDERFYVYGRVRLENIIELAEAMLQGLDLHYDLYEPVDATDALPVDEAEIAQRMTAAGRSDRVRLATEAAASSGGTGGPERLALPASEDTTGANTTSDDGGQTGDTTVADEVNATSPAAMSDAAVVSDFDHDGNAAALAEIAGRLRALDHGDAAAAGLTDDATEDYLSAQAHAFDAGKPVQDVGDGDAPSEVSATAGVSTPDKEDDEQEGAAPPELRIDPAARLIHTGEPDRETSRDADAAALVGDEALLSLAPDVEGHATGDAGSALTEDNAGGGVADPDLVVERPELQSRENCATGSDETAGDPPDETPDFVSTVDVGPDAAAGTLVDGTADTSAASAIQADDDEAEISSGDVSGTLDPGPLDQGADTSGVANKDENDSQTEASKPKHVHSSLKDALAEVSGNGAEDGDVSDSAIDVEDDDDTLTEVRETVVRLLNEHPGDSDADGREDEKSATERSSKRKSSATKPTVTARRKRNRRS